MPMQPPENGRTPAKQLGVWDAVNIIVGVVIGVGLYETAPLVYANVPSPGYAMLVWLLGGLLSLVGALCYAELVSTYPKSGGDYVYLTRAFGPLLGFLFGWAQLAILMTGSIGMLAYVFADYSAVLWQLGDAAKPWLAAAAVLALTLLNLRGAIVGKLLQNVLTGLKVVGLVAVVVAGLFWAPGAGTAAAPRQEYSTSFGLAMILVLYTYGGWNDAAFIAADVRDGKRGIPKALIIGTGAVTLIYLAVNAAFLYGLGFDQARASRAIAADALGGALGAFGAKAMSVLVVISALGAINGLIFTGSRVYASLGADYSIFARLGRWHPRYDAPLMALIAQGLVALALVLLLGTFAGRALIDGGLSFFGVPPARWTGHGGFDTLLQCTAPVFWAFFLLTGASLFVLRFKDRSRVRPFPVPLYPVLPLVFCGTCAYMLYSATDYAGTLAVIGIVPVALGLPLFFASRRRPAAEVAPLPFHQRHSPEGEHP
jgi:amino acid transporter